MSAEIKEEGMSIRYSVVEGWEQLPKGWAHRDVAGVAVDRTGIVRAPEAVRCLGGKGAGTLIMAPVVCSWRPVRHRT